MAELCRGRVLQPGDCIGLVAPASPVVSEEAVCSAVDFLVSLGYDVRLGETANVREGYLAGNDFLRAADVNKFFADAEVAAIWCLRGGYGTARLLNLLDYAMIAENPKLFIGYSDITALHIALYQRSRLITVHGTVAVQLAAADEYTRQEFLSGLRENLAGTIRLPPGRSLRTLATGRAVGRLVGGNLAVVASLIGTPYELDGRGCILFLEEVGEAPYRVDRMLNQLWQSGLLGRVRGVAFGDFTDCSDEAGTDISEVLSYYAGLCGKPALTGLPVGHGVYNMFLPYGVTAAMECSAAKAALTIKEA